MAESSDSGEGPVDQVRDARLEGVLLAARTIQHLVSNQLTLTVGYAAMLASDPRLPEDMREWAARAQQGAESAAATVRQFLEVHRVEERDWGTPSGPMLDLPRSLAAADAPPGVWLIGPSGTWESTCSSERRRFRRAAVSPPARTVAHRLPDRGRRVIPALILDVSAGGFLVRTDGELSVGDQLEVGFALPQLSDPVLARAEVVRVEHVPGRRYPWQAGCRFVNPDSPTRLRIERFVDSRQVA